MSRFFLFILAVLVCAALPASLSAAAKRPTDVWNYYHFDGIAFKPGPNGEGKAFIAVREKSRPVILATPAAPAENFQLPDGEGVIAGICYVQSSGGKLGSGPAFTPYPRVPLVVSSGGKELVTIQTDDHGFFVVVLRAGTYSIGSGPFTADITVENGVTTLVPLRVGKRMVD